MTTERKLRLVVYDVPEAEAPADVLLRAGYGSLSGFNDAATIRISIEDLQDQDSAETLLTERIYHLWHSRSDFLVLATFSRGRQKTIPPKTPLHALILDDIFSLLDGMSHQVSYTNIEIMDGYFATPIEAALAKEMSKAGIPYTAQARVGRHRLDFLVEYQGRKIGIEADGAQFHDPEADAIRDDIISAQGVDRILRFSGSRIMRDGAGCIQEIRDALNNSGVHRRLYPVDADLDASQLAAIDHSHGPARVLAPAGSGKTKTMINRIIRLLNRGISPESILVLAFNKKAADQLNESLSQRGIPAARALYGEGSAGVHASTFHSFGWRYMREVIGIKPEIEKQKTYWKEQMTRTLTAEGIDIGSIGAERNSDPLKRFLDALECAKSDLQSPEAITVEVETYKNGTVQFPFAGVFDRHTQETIKSQRYSFDDLVYIPYRDLMDNGEHRRRIQARFSYVLVDEYQDLNAVQLGLVGIIARPTMNLFVVGDDDQLIYGWRFARPENILDFENRFTNSRFAQTYVLNTNYRCSQSVVYASRRLIDNNVLRVSKDYHPRAEAPPGRITYFPSADWQERADRIIRFLREEKARNGCKWRKLAVLCRFKVQQVLIAQELDNCGIPRSPLLSYQLLQHKYAHVIRAYLEVIANPQTSSGEAWAAFISVPNRYLKGTEIEMIKASARGWDVVTNLLEEGNGAKRSLESAVEMVKKIHLTTRKETIPGDALVRMIEDTFQLRAYWTDTAAPSQLSKSDEAEPDAMIRALELFSSKYDDISTLLEGWRQEEEKEKKGEDVTEDSLVREEEAKRDAVVLGTIHSSKGREYDAVVILDYEHRHEGLSETEIEEERRVVYVGVTRAKTALLFTIAKPHKAIDPFVRETMMAGTGEEITDLENAKQQQIVQIAEQRTALKELLAHKEAVVSGKELLKTEEQYALQSQDREAVHRELEGVLKELPPSKVQKALMRLTRKGRKTIQLCETLTNQLQQLEISTRELFSWKAQLTEAKTEVVSQIDDRIGRLQQDINDAEIAYQATLDRIQEIHLVGRIITQ